MKIVYKDNMKILTVKTKIPKRDKNLLDSNITFKVSSKSFSNSFFTTKSQHTFSFISKTEKNKIGQYERLLAIITNKNDTFTFTPVKSMLKSSIDSFWLVINPFLLKEYQISEGDIINLGGQRVKIYKIKGMRQSKQLSFSEISINSFRKGGAGQKPKKEISEKPFPNKSFENFCRVCLGTEDSQENPYIVPCLCSGSMGYLHYKCFSEWILSKLSIESKEFFQSITFEPICCEACRFKIPDVFKSSHIKFNLLSVLNISRNFIVFEFPKTLHKNQRKLIVVSLELLYRFKITQNGEIFNSFEKNESGVFRVHNKKIFLTNEIDSYDTTVLMRKNILFENKGSSTLINENTLLKFSMDQKASAWKSVCCCFTEKNNE